MFCGQVLPTTKSITGFKQGKVTLKWTIIPSKGERPDWFSLYYQQNNQSRIIPIWYDSNGLLDYGKSKFNNSLKVNRPSTNRLDVTIDNLEGSMAIYLTVVFQDRSGTIVNGPIYSKYELESKKFVLHDYYIHFILIFLHIVL